jgi:D-sedoheptulose 7-phosphate isomerase
MEYDLYVQSCIRENCRVNEKVLLKFKEIIVIADSIVSSYNAGGKVLICGNGGSAADSQHIAGELVGRFKLERRALDARALTTDTSILTALGNDYSLDCIFARQVEAYGKKGDVLLGISTSGKSKDVIKAFEEGRKIGTCNIALTGDNGGEMKSLADLCFEVPSHDTPRVQEAHELIYHTICDLIEKKLFG